ncbi:hypothetical protein ACFS27_21735 [Promicromonospora vindobonensis]|uniref:Uncharacterized protein n=1 Tax=Promicromonospora vindobonensis TaxID=195748 RepID=A0ABW5VX14_9MICO
MNATGEFVADFAVAMIAGLLVVMIVAICATIWRPGRGPGPTVVIVASAALGLVLAVVSLVLHDNVWLIGTAAVLATGLLGAWLIALRSDGSRSR